MVANSAADYPEVFSHFGVEEALRPGLSVRLRPEIVARPGPPHHHTDQPPGHPGALDPVTFGARPRGIPTRRRARCDTSTTEGAATPPGRGQ